MSSWTIETYIVHNEAMRKADEKFQNERDRRYTEVNIEKEKALKIKETADLAALSLARDIQIYKDEKANELREQINSERGLYVTHAEIKPVLDYVASQQGRSTGFQLAWGIFIAIATIAVYVAFNLGKG